MADDSEKNKVVARLETSPKFSHPTARTAKNSRRFSHARAVLRHKEVGSHDWAVFWGTLARMLEAGIGGSAALSFQAENITNARLSRLARAVSDSVSQGKSLHLSCAAPEFKPLHVSLIKVGEETGRIPEILARLARFEEDQARLRLAIRSFLTYPLILFSIAVLFALIVPGFFRQPITLLFAATGVKLPLFLQVLFTVSTWLCDPKTLSFLALFGLVWHGVWVRLFLSEPVQRASWKTILRLPGLKNIVQTVSEQRLAEVLAFTRNAGVSAVRSFELVGETMGNPIFRSACFAAADHIEQGGDTLSAIRTTGVTSGAFLTVLASGEEAGRLPELLESYAELLSLKLEENLKTAVSILQPVLLGCLALFVLLLAVSVVGPLSQIIEAL